MKKFTNVLVFGMVIASLGVVWPVMATDDAYGTTAASKVTDEKLTLSKMLTCALQDEYLARGEYRKIMEKFGTRRPFSNIVKAEGRHICRLMPLFKKHNVPVPPDRGMELAKVPATYVETFQIGVDAEVANIAMYERFLKRDLPKDVRAAFNCLLAGSKNHLAAFKKKRKRSR